MKVYLILFLYPFIALPGAHWKNKECLSLAWQVMGVPESAIKSPAAAQDLIKRLTDGINEQERLKGRFTDVVAKKSTIIADWTAKKKTLEERLRQLSK